DKNTIGQYLFLFSMSAKPADLDNVVDYPFQKGNIWVQLKTWDAQGMRDVIRTVDEYARMHSTRMEFRPAGTAYFNLVWNNEVLYDMIKGFILALIVIFVILAFNFRSIKWALVGYIPLLLTVLLIYGVVGFTGKDFDMPISVLSTLSLGMAVDFAIHFISRFKQRMTHAYKSESLTESLLWTSARPGKGIMRNAFLFATAFSVMLFASLTPYITVGAFIVSMMMISALLTIMLMPALISLLKGWLFTSVKEKDHQLEKDYAKHK
ncbi:MAG: MMPL family transporter, partial [Acidobacteriota bacterium]